MKWCVLIIFSPNALGTLELIAICANKRGRLRALSLAFRSPWAVSPLSDYSFVRVDNDHLMTSTRAVSLPTEKLLDDGESISSKGIVFSLPFLCLRGQFFFNIAEIKLPKNFLCQILFWRSLLSPKNFVLWYNSFFFPSKRSVQMWM